MPKRITTGDYTSFLSSIKTEIRTARIKAARVVNRELISLYLKIGEMIVKKQEELGWGKSVVERLSKDIRKEFEGIQGFSPRNLWDMKRMFEQYWKHPKLRQLVAEIPWGHNLLIINKIEHHEERKYYMQATIDNGWSRNVLLNQIKAGAYARHKSLKKHITLPKHCQCILPNRQTKCSRTDTC